MVRNEDFPEYFNKNLDFQENLVTSDKIMDIIRKLNQRSATIFDDLPMKLISLFSQYLSNPSCNIINSIFETGSYPEIWKRELITPVKKYTLVLH